VAINLPDTTNPASNDDLTTVNYLDSLTIEDGVVAVDHTLTVASLNLSANAGAMDGGADRGVYADSDLTGDPSLLVIDSITGSGGDIAAAGSGALTDVLASSDPGETYEAADGGELILNAAPSTSTELYFSDGPGTLALEHPGPVVGALLYDAGVGDVLELPGSAVSAVHFGAHSLTITTSAGTTTFSDVDYKTGSLAPSGYTASHDASTGLEAITFTGVTCYVSGTKVLTSRGPRAVETLQIGDRLKTLHSGYQPIKWIGTRSYEGRFIEGNQMVLPICIKRNAIDDNLPSQDLFVSPGHAICIDGVLIHASRLVNGVSVVQAERVETVAYYHIEMENHEIIFAEDCPAETFIGEKYRNQFQNAAEFSKLYPGEVATETYCLPLLESGFQLHALQRRLASRAGIATPLTQRQGPLRGHVDLAGPTRCCGWVQDLSNPEEPVCLDITADGRTIGRVLANLYRPDVRAAGFGSGYHGFEFSLPSSATGRIDAVRTSDRAMLPWTQSAAAAAACN
jgi:hypothetical protein